jgi:HSP20 family protein
MKMGSIEKKGKMHQEIDKALHGIADVFEHKSNFLKNFDNMLLSPALDLVEDTHGFKLEVELPGLDETDIRLSIKGNVLTIRGEKSVSKKDENKNYIFREIAYGRYERHIAMPATADLSRCSANFKKGMLWINVPKLKSSQQIKIDKA